MKLEKLTNTKYIIEFDSEEEANQVIVKLQPKKYLKAGEVMKLLDITRQTLCHYVKANKIVVVKMPGGQYRYDCTNLFVTTPDWNRVAEVVYRRAVHPECLDELTRKELDTEILKTIPLEVEDRVEYIWTNILNTYLVRKLSLHVISGEKHPCEIMHEYLEKIIK